MLKRNKKNLKVLLKNILSISIILFLTVLIFSIFAFAILLTKFNKDLPNPNKLIERTVPESTKIYDKTGKFLLYEIHGDQKRTSVELKDISKNLINATISAEDKNFYTHNGLELKGIIRGAIKTIIFRKASQSGSTLTQQLVKNAILTNEKTLERKIKEWVLTYKIEKQFSKDDILKMYLNEIPYGSVIYGAEAASESFFGKEAKDLTIEEAALIAAIPQSPTTLSPYKPNNEKLIWRYGYVLGQMKANGYISQEEYDKAMKTDIIKTVKPKNEKIFAPHFVMYVKQQLEEKYGETMVEQGGLKIITTLDYEKQKEAERIITTSAPNIAKNFNGNNIALLSINAKTGEIETMVGSKDYFNEEFGAFNVTINKRQLGSSFKPIVYAAAFQKGFTPDTMLFDVVTDFNKYIPKNYDLKERGPVSIRKALAGSLNIPAVKTLYLTGLDNVIKLARSLGYKTISLDDKNKYGLTLALGTIEATMMDHVKAFSTFAADGIQHETKSILKVTKNNGQVLEDNTKVSGLRIIDKEIANQINSILSDNNARSYIFGTKNNLTLKDRVVAAKTGTTNDYKDTWTIGYTPNIVTAVWVGNNNNKEMKRGSASMISAPIWQEYMEFATKNDKKEYFTEPKYENKNNLMLNGQWINTKKVKIDMLSGLLATTETPVELIQEKDFIDLHDILYYIDKNDLSKEVVVDRTDSQYLLWEQGVKTWFNNLVNKTERTKEEQETITTLLKHVGDESGDIKNYLIDKIPSQIDTIHSQSSITLSITYPTNNLQNSSTQLPVKISYTSNNNISKVEYFIDGVLIMTKINAPFNEDVLNLSGIGSGQHLLEVQIFDQYLNSKKESVIFIK